MYLPDIGKIFNNNNSGEFVLPPPTGNQYQNAPELLLLNFCHYQTATATSGPPPLILQLFLCFPFCMGWFFFFIFRVWLFCVNFSYSCNLTCIFAFAGYS